MKPILSALMLAATLAAHPSAHAQSSMLRVVCGGEDVGAEVSVNGKIKGTCPVDMLVEPGTLKLRVEKKVGDLGERVFESEIRMGEGVAKKVEAVLTMRLNAEGQKREEDRLAAEAVRKEQEFWQRAQAAEEAPAVQAYLDKYPKGSYLAAAQEKLAVIRRAAAEPRKVFKDCSDCPEMVVIPAGSFEMGGTYGDEQPIHRVTVKGFALGKTEVTQGQWKTLMDRNPSKFSDCGDDCPVETVDWESAQEFARKLSAKTGKTYRLPSEAEWEYACRAGGRQQYCGSESADSVAWHEKNSGKKTHPVAGKEPNAWGLYDMSGNVEEWTEDCWNDTYRGAPSDGSAWRNGDCERHGTRGGSWNAWSLGFLKSVRRSFLSNRNLWLGFRLARMLP